MEKLTFKRVKALAREVIDSVPGKRDFVYNENKAGCFYVKLSEYQGQHDSRDVPFLNDPNYAKSITPCIVGAILQRAGVDTTFLNNCGETVVGIFHAYYKEHLPQITPKALKFLQQAQAQQDSGASWGESYDIAKKDVEKYDWSSGVLPYGFNVVFPEYYASR